jgi:hypothetical protein
MDLVRLLNCQSNSDEESPTQDISPFIKIRVLGRQNDACYFCHQLLQLDDHVYFIKMQVDIEDDFDGNYIAVCQSCHEHIHFHQQIGVYELTEQTQSKYILSLHQLIQSDFSK